MSRLVGLDIGTKTIKAVELEGQDGKKQSHLINVGLSATPPKGLLSEATLDQQALTNAIKKTLGDSKISTKTVNIALPESLVFTRVITMPVLSEKELASAIRWEAEQYIPLPLTEVVLDYQVMGTAAARANAGMDIFLVAAPKTLVAKYQKIVTMAGLEIVSIETESLALHRALIGEQTGGPVTLVISIGAERTNIFITKGASILLTYSIPSGGNALSRALVADLNIDLLQAEEYKKTYGLKKEVLSGKVGATVRPILDNFIAELRRTISFYQSKGSDTESIRLVMLVGGGAKLPELVAFLAENLGIETQIGDPWQKVADTHKLTSQPFDPILFSEAVGLALKRVS